MSKIQVCFAYNLNSLNAEMTVAVIANVYSGSEFPEIQSGVPTECADGVYAEIVSATFHPQGRHKAWLFENIPPIIREDMEAMAIEKAVEKVFSESPEFQY